MAVKYNNGVWKNPETGKYEVRKHGHTVKIMDIWEQAMAYYRGQPIPPPPGIKHGVIKKENINSVRYLVFINDTYVGTYKYELTANQRFAKFKESNDASES